jgi:hypothetical protein
MKKLLFGWVLVAAIWSSCKNDVQLNAEYKEIVVVYGLLDRNDTVHYIRIQRAYQNTNATAQSIAQNPDSLYFDSLDVTVTDQNTSVVYHLTKDVSVYKDTGYFQNKVNVLYRFSDPLAPTHIYRLDIKNLLTGNAVYGSTLVVGNPQQITGPAGDTIDILVGKKIRASFKSGINARAYDVFFRFRYDEFDSATGNLMAQKHLDYYLLRSGLTSSTSGGEDIEQSIQSDDLITFIGNAIEEKEGVKRVATHLDAFYAGAAEDLNVYLDVSKPSIGIVQKKPEFTNVVNGYGLFSSRNVFMRPHPLNTATQKTLRDNIATKHLGWK